MIEIPTTGTASPPVRNGVVAESAVVGVATGRRQPEPPGRTGSTAPLPVGSRPAGSGPAVHTEAPVGTTAHRTGREDHMAHMVRTAVRDTPAVRAVREADEVAVGAPSAATSERRCCCCWPRNPCTATS